MESLSDIVAQIRAVAYIQNADPPKSVLRFADRIEAAWRREREDIEADGIAKGINGHAEVCMKHGFYDNDPVGNAAALLKALRALRDASRGFYNQILNSKYSGILDKDTCVKQGFPAVLDLRYAIKMANYALSAPPRNCDVGKPEEQGVRCLAAIRHWRKAYRWDALITAIMKWAQEPYNAKEGGAQ